MRLVRCPICSLTVDFDAGGSRPFFSERCRQIDLGKWLGEEYRVPVGPDFGDPGEDEEV